MRSCPFCIIASFVLAQRTDTNKRLWRGKCQGGSLGTGEEFIALGSVAWQSVTAQWKMLLVSKQLVTAPSRKVSQMVAFREWKQKWIIFVVRIQHIWRPWILWRQGDFQNEIPHWTQRNSRSSYQIVSSLKSCGPPEGGTETTLNTCFDGKFTTNNSNH